MSLLPDSGVFYAGTRSGLYTDNDGETRHVDDAGDDGGGRWAIAYARSGVFVVLSDAPERAEPRMTRLPFRSDTTMVSGEYATRMRTSRSVAPGRIVMRDRCDRLPATTAERTPLDVTTFDAKDVAMRERLE